MVSKEDKIHCCLLIGKARVVPKKFVSILRLQLTVATLSLKVVSLPKKELKFDEVEERFQTDSKVVLGYITNDVQQFVRHLLQTECNKLKTTLHQVNGPTFQLKKILQIVHQLIMHS